MRYGFMLKGRNPFPSSAFSPVGVGSGTIPALFLVGVIPSVEAGAGGVGVNAPLLLLVEGLTGVHMGGGGSVSAPGLSLMEVFSGAQVGGGRAVNAPGLMLGEVCSIVQMGGESANTSVLLLRGGSVKALGLLLMLVFSGVQEGGGRVELLTLLLVVGVFAGAQVEVFAEVQWGVGCVDTLALLLMGVSPGVQAGAGGIIAPAALLLAGGGSRWSTAAISLRTILEDINFSRIMEA